MNANTVEALTLHWQGSDLVADAERFEIETDLADSLILSWNATGIPDGYASVAQGAAFLRNDPRTKTFQQKSKPNAHPQNEYGWCDTAHQGIMALIVVFPDGHSPQNAATLSPVPFSAKIFENRIAVVWALSTAEHEVRWQITPSTPTQTAQTVREINERAARERDKDKQPNIGIQTPENHIRLMGENRDALRRKFDDLPKNQKKARKDALFAWNTAARDYFSACITAFFTEAPRTQYTDSAGWAADWLHDLVIHYGCIKAESVPLGIDFQQLQPHLLKFKELQHVVAEREEAAARQLRDDFVRVGLPTFGFDEVLSAMAGRKPTEDVPKKIWIPALVFTSVLLSYFMILTWRSQSLDESRQDLANKMFALLAGFSALFIGGTALFALEFPKNKTARIGFSATAGIAVFAFVWSYSPYWFKPKDASPPVASTDAHRIAAQKLDTEISARIEGALKSLENSEHVNWLDGTTSTNEGTALAFAGNYFRGVMAQLDQASGSDIAYRGRNLRSLLQDLESHLSSNEQSEVEAIFPRYRELSAFAEQIPPSEDSSRRFTRQWVAETRVRMTKMLLAMRLPRWR